MKPRSFYRGSDAWTILGAFIVLSIIIMAMLQNNAMIFNIAAALLSATLGSTMTVTIITSWQAANDRHKQRHATRAYHQMLSLLFGKFKQLWCSMMVAAGRDPNAEDIFSATSWAYFFSSISIDTNANVVTYSGAGLTHLTWRQYLPDQIEYIQSELDKCMTFYSAQLDPEIILSIQKLRAGFMLTTLFILRVSKSVVGAPYATSLGDDLSNWRDLSEYLDKVSVDLEELGIS